jgi:hypothetical protein
MHEFHHHLWRGQVEKNGKAGQIQKQNIKILMYKHHRKITFQIELLFIPLEIGMVADSPSHPHLFPRLELSTYL